MIKKTRRFIGLLIALCLIVGMLPAALAAEAVPAEAEKEEKAVAEFATVVVTKTFSLPEGVTFDNFMRQQISNFQLSLVGDEKKDIGPVSYVYYDGGTFKSSNEADTVRATDNGFVWVIENVPEGGYSFEERGAEPKEYHLDAFLDSVKVAAGDTAEVTLTNVYSEPGDYRVLIYKNLVGVDIDQLPQDACVELRRSEAVVKAGTTLTIPFSSFTQIDDNLYFCSYTNNALSAGEYDVYEQNVEIEGYSLYSEYPEYINVSDAAVTELDLFNEYTFVGVGSLIIEKTFEGITKDQIPENFHMVLLPRQQDFPPMKDSGTSDAKATFQPIDMLPAVYIGEDGNFETNTGRLRKLGSGIGFRWDIGTIEAGKYFIDEFGAEIEGYSHLLLGDREITVEDGDSTTVPVKNIYSDADRMLLIGKEVSGLDGEDKMPRDARIVLTPVEGSTQQKEISVPFTKFETATMNGMEVYYLILEDDDIPAGEYYVEEQGAELDGYDLHTDIKIFSDGGGNEEPARSVQKTVFIPEEGRVQVIVTNDYERITGTIYIYKYIYDINDIHVEKSAAAKRELALRSLNFTLEGPNGYKKQLKIGDFEQGNGSYYCELENMTAGKYTLRETGASVPGYNLLETHYWAEYYGDNNEYFSEESQIGYITGQDRELRFYVDNGYEKGGIGGGDDDEPDYPVLPITLNGEDHFDYIQGYPDGLVHPEGNITRAEVATIFFRLLKDEVREEYWAETNNFSDVDESMWYNHAVSTLANMGILHGYNDGTFKPNGMITRAEFATIAVAFNDKADIPDADFSDLSDHWAAVDVSIAAANGWVNGYPDGTFGPDSLITRAEAMAIVNRVLNRHPASADDLLDGMITWADNADTSKWYYLDVQEATNNHEYSLSGENETWTKILASRDWTLLEK